MRQTIWLPDKNFPIFIDQENRNQAKSVIRLHRRTDVITGGPKWVGEIVSNFIHLPFRAIIKPMWNDDIGTLYFTFAGPFVVYVSYKFEDYAHYHDRTGKGHPDAAIREAIHNKYKLQ